MSLLGKIFGKDDVIKKSVDGVYNGIDAMVFTKEERAEHLLRLLKAYEPFKLIQRILATVVAVVYLGIWVLSAIIYTSSLFFDPCAVDVAVCTFTQTQEVSKNLAAMNNETLGIPFATIMALYFGGGMLEGSLRARK